MILNPTAMTMDNGARWHPILVQIMFDEPWDNDNDNGMKNENDSKSKSAIVQSDQYE